MKVITILLCSILPFISVGQQSTSIQVNDMFIGMDAFGQLARYDGKYGEYGPSKTPGNSDYFTNWFWELKWASGYDENQQIRFFNDTVNFNILNTSPLLTSSGDVLNNTGAYHRVWSVHRTEIENHLADYADNNQIDEPVSISLLSWPGKGNPHFQTIFGIPAQHDDLAPFYDQNDNEIYEPLLGDYPILDKDLPSVIPDQMCFTVFNDIVDSNSLGIEIHDIVFAFYCDTLSDINQTIFNKRTYINKSGHAYADFAFGNNSDADIGCPEDDFYGTAISLNTVYGYNQDAIDGEVDSVCNVGGLVPTYGNNPGVVAITYLSPGFESAITTPRNGQGFPVIDYASPDVRHKLLHGIICAQPLNSDSTTIDTVGFSYTDYPTIPDGNHMHSIFDKTFDTRLITGNTTPLFSPGEQRTVYRSIYYNSDRNLNNLEEAENLENKIPVIQGFFDSGFSLPCQQPIEFCTDDCVWPGDANHDGIVLVDDFLPIQYGSIQGFSASARHYESDYWAGFGANEWTMSYNDGQINMKHADCYGDGSVDLTDLLVTDKNYRLSTPSVSEGPLVVSSPLNNKLTIKPLAAQHLENESYFQRIILSNSIKTTLESNEPILGISFSIDLDSTFFEYRFGTNGERINFNEIKFISGQKDAREANRADFFIATKSSLPLESQQSIRSDVRVILREGLRVPDGQDSLHIPFPIYNVKAMNMDGDYIDFHVETDSIWLFREFSSIRDRSEDIELTISPNPTNSITTFHSTEKINDITLFSINGSIEKHEQVNDYMTQLNVADISPGIYIAQIAHSKGIVHRKILISNK